MKRREMTLEEQDAARAAHDREVAIIAQRFAVNDQVKAGAQLREAEDGWLTCIIRAISCVEAREAKAARDEAKRDMSRN